MKVCITETLQRIVEVESVEEAKKLYRDCDIVLEADDFIDVSFETINE